MTEVTKLTPRIFLAAGLLIALPAAALAQGIAEWDKVEAKMEDDSWRSCVVKTVMVGAYDLQCDDYMHYLVRDVNVRKPGGSAGTQTLAQAVEGPPFKAGDLVLASPVTLATVWELCMVVRPVANDYYQVTCANQVQKSVPAKWVRVDPKAPEAAAP